MDTSWILNLPSHKVNSQDLISDLTLTLCWGGGALDICVTLFHPLQSEFSLCLLLGIRHVARGVMNVMWIAAMTGHRGDRGLDQSQLSGLSKRWLALSGRLHKSKNN